MSKSRLEKFLYALYSLDSSDLPNPLSRIEELYKCLVTGEEAPTFKPLSRVEKYLMAILGGYDLNELPNPISRVEVLLYKLATGDDNLDDVKSFLSEHEELLAEIIRNGGAGGNIDIEYVLHTLSTGYNTLYNTAEKPVKSAVLKGQTLVNLLSESNINVKSSNTYRINYTHNLNTTKTYILQYRINQIPELSDTTDSARLLKFEWYSGNKYGGYSDIFIRDITVGNDNFIMINPFNDEVTKTYFGIWCPNYVSGSLDMDIILIEYQDGMENWDIPYFEGVQSVKMPVLTSSGKNLFNVELEQGSVNTNTGTLIETMFAIRSKDFIKLSSNETFTISKSNGTQIITVVIYDKNYKFVRALWEQTFTLTGDEMYVKIADTENDLNNQYQIEKGKTPSSCEPHKSNILTVNEEVELRGIGDVQDTLDCLTGEVTERIGEVVLNGSDDVIFNVPFDGVYEYELDGLASNMIITIPKTTLVNYGNPDYNGYYYTIENNIRIINHDCKSVSEFKQWLSQNPILIQYQLKTESVKTVDLSVVDRDGSNTKLSTFDDITHVTLSSEGLIPEAELEVATKNEEVLNTMSLEMDDISTTQNALQETSDIQSENVDATMVATTEIYEGLL